MEKFNARHANLTIGLSHYKGVLFNVLMNFSQSKSLSKSANNANRHAVLALTQRLTANRVLVDGS